MPTGADAALEPRANIAACFVNTHSALIAITRVRARLRAANWDAGEVLEIRQVRRSSCVEDPEMLQQFDLAFAAGISVRFSLGPDFVREQLAHLPARFRNDPGWIFLAELLRLDPAFRAVYTASGSGGVVWDIDESRLPEAVLALRFLPDDAGGELVAEALARFRIPRAR